MADTVRRRSTGGARQMPNKKDPNSIKLVVVGDGAVGKTSMLTTFITGKFPKEYIPTVFENHNLKREVDGATVDIEIWDTAGQEEYESIRTRSYVAADVFIVTFSIESRSSFENAKTKWLHEVVAHAPDAALIGVGAKADLREDDGVLAEMKSLGSPVMEYQEYASALEQRGVKYYCECSALKNSNLDKVFDLVIQAHHAKMEQEEIEAKARREAGTTNRRKSGSCNVM